MCVTPPAQRECFICGQPAEHECLQCLPDRKLQPGRIKQYCSICNAQVDLSAIAESPVRWSCSRKQPLNPSLLLQVHRHHSRQGHTPEVLAAAAASRAADGHVSRCTMELFAVLCIQTSHYVCFVKYGPGVGSWLFFDSMADRCGETAIFYFLKCIFFSLPARGSGKHALLPHGCFPL